MFLGAEPPGGRLLGIGVLTDGVSCDPEFPSDGPQGQSFQSGLLDRLPPGLLGGRGRTLPRVRGLAGRVSFDSSLDRGFIDTHRFEGGQALLLGLADMGGAHAADDALELRAWRPSSDRGPQCAMRGGGSCVATVCP